MIFKRSIKCPIPEAGVVGDAGWVPGLALVPPQPLGVVAVVGGQGPGLLLTILRINQTQEHTANSAKILS